MTSLNVDKQIPSLVCSVVTYSANMYIFKRMSFYMVIHEIVASYFISTVRAFPFPGCRVFKIEARIELAIIYIEVTKVATLL